MWTSNYAALRHLCVCVCCSYVHVCIRARVFGRKELTHCTSAALPVNIWGIIVPSKINTSAWACLTPTTLQPDRAHTTAAFNRTNRQSGRPNRTTGRPSTLSIECVWERKRVRWSREKRDGGSEQRPFESKHTGAQQTHHVSVLSIRAASIHSTAAVASDHSTHYFYICSANVHTPLPPWKFPN